MSSPNNIKDINENSRIPKNILDNLEEYNLNENPRIGNVFSSSINSYKNKSFNILSVNDYTNSNNGKYPANNFNINMKDEHENTYSKLSFKQGLNYFDEISELTINNCIFNKSSSNNRNIPENMQSKNIISNKNMPSINSSLNCVNNNLSNTVPLSTNNQIELVHSFSILSKKKTNIILINKKNDDDIFKRPFDVPIKEKEKDLKKKKPSINLAPPEKKKKSFINKKRKKDSTFKSD